MARLEAEESHDLPRDNASRIAIYDALHEYFISTSTRVITEDELFERVIGRLRILVPRELHLAGEREYVQEKIEACVKGGLFATESDSGLKVLTLTSRLPMVRYPDGGLRDYTPGLELARERIDHDNANLRAAWFDVRQHIPSIADAPENPQFQALLASMSEHGFMKQFPVVESEDGVVIDGRARIQAAAKLRLQVEYFKYGAGKNRKTARRRDTPLNRVLVAVHSNSGRLPDNIVTALYASVEGITGRPWEETAADLALTRDWRQSIEPEYAYSPRFDVKRLAFREGDEAKIQVTSDGKVQLRSLIEAGGLSNYKIAMLEGYVPFESARTVYSAGRKAVFARVEDLIPGIAAMQQERQAGKRKVDPEWEQIRQWLIRTFEEA